MNKVIILSVQPQWLHKIITGKKTIEIRKSAPKCDLPIDVYLYCTKGNTNLFKVFREVYMYFDMGVAEPFEDFKYYKLDEYDYSGKGKARFEIENGFYDELYHKLNGKIVAKFTLNKVGKFKVEFLPLLQEMGYVNPYTLTIFDGGFKTIFLEQKSCLLLEDIYKYNEDKNTYAWHIDNLQIFDKPMELKEFKYQCQKGEKNRCDGCDFYYFNQNESVGTEEECLCDCMPRLKRPFQSWGYVYKEE